MTSREITCNKVRMLQPMLSRQRTAYHCGTWKSLRLTLITSSEMNSVAANHVSIVDAYVRIITVYDAQ